MIEQSGLVERMIRAARADVALYNEVEHDLNATNQALMVVVIGAVSTGLGTALGAAMAGRNPAMPLVFGIIASLFGWAVWSFVTYFIGTRVMGGTATYGELLRTIGFANTPSVLGIVGVVPGLGSLAGIVLGIWSLYLGFLAVREALDFDSGKAIATVIIGWIGMIAIMAVFAVIGGTAAFLSGVVR
ncbi:MAG: YIP1 family protein [Chloroflexi bacterium]|nr:YIP1 family protein [Chloroflexota bacterium]